jgi:[acyl-carrier-protein] S-malonyltransferase
MLDPFRDSPEFGGLYDRMCAELGDDPLARAKTDPAVVNRNVVSSLLTVVASVLALERLHHSQPRASAVAVSGYSVGQWSALHAAGVIDAETLIRVVAARARLMDECIEAAPPSGMLAVIGVREADLMAICAEAASRGETLEITNWNAPAQSTLGGTEEALAWATERLRPLRPKRVLRIAVAGAWHSTLLAPAVDRLARLLASVELRAARVPVIDNTTGAWLPEDPAARRSALARQVAAPVRWHEGVRTLIGHGARELLEVGYGDVLTRFGFFVDRSVAHRAIAAPPRPAR